MKFLSACLLGIPLGLFCRWVLLHWTNRFDRPLILPHWARHPEGGLSFTSSYAQEQHRIWMAEKNVEADPLIQFAKEVADLPK